MPKTEIELIDFEILVRDSEKLEVIKRYIKTTDFPNKKTLLAILEEYEEGESTDAEI